MMYGLQPTAANFYPRPPQGGRHSATVFAFDIPNFYPRPPQGGRPPALQGLDAEQIISIHALRKEGD